jgi:large subunit ribosomal protein L1
MPTKETFIKALEEVRKSEKESEAARKFEQTVDLIINLRDFDIKRSSINIAVALPHKLKDKKVAAFLEKKSGAVDTITKVEFEDFKDKKKLKRLVKEYDFFISSAKLMPTVATTFGRVLGPAGKMPTPQLGVLMGAESDEAVKALMIKINSVVRVKTKEPSIKVSIGKQTDKDADLAENAMAVYNEVYKNLPKQRENLKNVLIKFTMSKPAKVAL